MFPTETWRRTGKSYDGKKDFVFPAEESLPDQKWAECKNYESNLSLNIIAPTLIMGAIERINHILFFSYSPLNDNAIEGLLRYSELGGRTIRIYDGTLLEYIICTYSATHGIADFFPGTDFGAARAKLKKHSLRKLLTLRDSNGVQISSDHRFAQGEPFSLQIIVQNLTWEPIDCSIAIQPVKETILRCKCNKRTFLLSAAEIQQYSVLCEALREGRAGLKVEITAQTTETKIETVYRKIEVSDEPYLAWSGHNALAARDVCLQHLQERNMAPLLIAGKTGTGKSTLLQILLSEPVIQTHYRILTLDLHQSRSAQTRALFSQALGIRGEDQSPREQADDDKKALALLIDNYAKSAEEIAVHIMAFYDPARPYLLVLDDVQDMSGPHTALLQELDNRAKEADVPIYYLLALNESVLGVEDLLFNFNWDALYQNREPHLVRLTTFQCADILTYFKTRYGLQDIDGYFSGIILELSPLELNTFCGELKDGHVIAREPCGQAYQIVDPFRFSERIKWLCHAKVPLKQICAALDRNGMSESILKHLYVTGRLSEKLKKNRSIIERLMNQGLLKQTGDTVTFYHREIRAVIRESLTFSEDDCADIIADPETGEEAKALCVLEQFGKLRNGKTFLQAFWKASPEISTPDLRAELCQLIFQQAEQLSDAQLLSDGLRFVRDNFRALNEENGHASFFRFLRLIADTALRCQWDLSEDSVENMAFFLKKFLDRALSSYHEQEVMPYFLEYQKRFPKLQHIEDTRRNFWLSHYANRAAIALDRTSDPTKPEPPEVSALYVASHAYFAKAGKSYTLDLQLAVDELNRHYIYRHDLTIQHIRKTYQRLCEIQTATQDAPLDEPMVLNYHLLLLEYLQARMEGSAPVPNFSERRKETAQRCRSPFYAIKLQIMELYRFIELGDFSNAASRLSTTYAFAYKKELRPFIYKLTCIKAQLLALRPTIFPETDDVKQAALALAQMLDIHGQEVNALLREAFLLTPMARKIAAYDPKALATIAERQKDDTKALLRQLDAYLQGKGVAPQTKIRFSMKSYFVFQGLDFPAI